MSDQQPRPETISLHGGQVPDPTTNARAVPIYQTLVRVRRRPARRGPLRASRPGQHLHADHEPDLGRAGAAGHRPRGRVAACVTASGQAAVTYAVLNITRTGDNIVSLCPLRRHLQPLRAHPAAVRHRGAVRRPRRPGRPRRARRREHEAGLRRDHRQPALNVVDIDAWSEAAHAAGLPLVVDNTVATPSARARRPRRRHRDPLADEVHRRPRHLHRRHRRRQRHLRLDRARTASRASPSPTPLPRRRLERRPRAGRLHRPRAHRAAAQHRRRALAVQRLPVPAGHRDAAAADGAPLANALAVARTSSVTPR